MGLAWAPRAPCPSARPPLHTHTRTCTHSPPCSSTRPHAHSQTCTQSTSHSGTHTGSRARTRTHTHGHRSLTHTVLSEASLGDCGFAQKLPTMDYSCFVGVCLLGEGSRSQEETAAGFRGFGWNKCLPLKGPHTPPPLPRVESCPAGDGKTPCASSLQSLGPEWAVGLWAAGRVLGLEVALISP